MKNLNEKFTDKEFEELNRLKNFIGLPWHDLLLRIFREGEITAIKMLIEDGYTKEEIEDMFTADD